MMATVEHPNLEQRNPNQPNPEQPNPEQQPRHQRPTFAAVVTDIRLRDRAPGRARWQLALDRTEFQPGDLGVIEAVAARSGARLVVPIVAVEADPAGEIWHTVEKPIGTGTRVTGAVRSRGASV